jgi:hypothetical protein
MPSSDMVEELVSPRPGLHEIGKILDRVYDQIGRKGDTVGKTSDFPASELFSEGWMLRLLLDWYSRNRGPATVGHALHFYEGARWFSEASLRSPLKEDGAQADGVIGDFEIRDGTKSGTRVKPDAAQFVVVEAKMGSKIAKRTKKHEEYDQITRSILCACFEAAEGGVSPGALREGIRVVVVGPHELFERDEEARQLRANGALPFRDRAQKALVKQTWRKGVNPQTVREWLNCVEAVAVSWEEVLNAVFSVQPEVGVRFKEFYGHCRTANGLPLVAT